jgi:hypothetical protein
VVSKNGVATDRAFLVETRFEFRSARASSVRRQDQGPLVDMFFSVPLPPVTEGLWPNLMN